MSFFWGGGCLKFPSSKIVHGKSVSSWRPSSTLVWLEVSLISVGLWFSHCDLRQAAKAPGKLIEMQVLKPHNKTIESDSGSFCFNKTPRWFECGLSWRNMQRQYFSHSPCFHNNFHTSSVVAPYCIYFYFIFCFYIYHMIVTSQLFSWVFSCSFHRWWRWKKKINLR